MNQRLYACLRKVRRPYERECTLVAGADDDFEELPLDVDLLRFRDHGV